MKLCLPVVDKLSTTEICGRLWIIKQRPKTWLPLQDYFRTFSGQNVSISDVQTMLKAS
jgi:hypothetical protein